MFSLLCLATSIICVALCAVLLIWPGDYVALYGLPVDQGAAFMGRRAAPLLLGLAVFFFALRDVAPGPLQDATAWAAALTFGGIAVTGVVAYVLGIASFAILVAAGLEGVVALAFLLAR